MENIPQELVECLTQNGYYDCKLVNGEVAGLHDYFTTRGIVVGLSSISYERRYCYQDREAASRALREWDGTTDHPPGNWIKLKGRWKGEPVDMLNPEWSNT